MANLGTYIGDFNAVGTLISGRRLHATDLVWRLRTDEGGLFTDRTYGYNLQNLLNETIEPERLPAIANRIELECMKDERTKSASARLSLEAIGGTVAKQRLRVEVDIEGDEGPFKLVINVTSDDFTHELWEH